MKESSRTLKAFKIHSRPNGKEDNEWLRSQLTGVKFNMSEFNEGEESTRRRKRDVQTVFTDIDL